MYSSSHYQKLSQRKTDVDVAKSYNFPPSSCPLRYLIQQCSATCHCITLSCFDHQIIGRRTDNLVYYYSFHHDNVVGIACCQMYKHKQLGLVLLCVIENSRILHAVPQFIQSTCQPCKLDAYFQAARSIRSGQSQLLWTTCLIHPFKAGNVIIIEHKDFFDLTESHKDKSAQGEFPNAHLFVLIAHASICGRKTQQRCHTVVNS